MNDYLCQNKHMLYSVEDGGSGLSIKYKALDVNAEIAAYVMDYELSEPLLKIWYRVEGEHKNIRLLPKKYYVKFFVKSSKSGAIVARYYQAISLKSGADFKEVFKDRVELKECLLDFLKSGVGDLEFGILRSAKHGSISVPKFFFNNFSRACYQLLQDESFYSRREFGFLINSLAYIAEEGFVKDHLFQIFHLLLTNKDLISNKDLVYILGLLSYKTGNKEEAEKIFRKLVLYKSDLSYHQTGAISYFFDPSQFIEVNCSSCISWPVVIQDDSICKWLGCVLISCDYGYFFAYVKEALKKIPKDLLVHIHILFEEEVDLSGVSKVLRDYANVFYTYEVFPGGDFKTYCSVARYIVLPDVIDKYGIPVLVSDADIDFSSIDLKNIFMSSDEKKISLVVKDQDLPWLKVMAGFNLFGSSVANAIFLKILRGYIKACFDKGLDSWMLDQVALSSCYDYFLDNRSNFEDDIYIERFLKLGVKQVSNRSSKRVEAKKALDRLKKI